ncbi:hypothetical protein EIN_065590, partial [Entamoeba invadens IP1]
MVQLEAFYFANVLLYIRGMSTFQKLLLVSRNIRTSFDMLRINPQNFSSGIGFMKRIFPKLNTLKEIPSVCKKYVESGETQITYFDLSQSVCDLSNKVFEEQKFCDSVVSLRINNYDIDKVGKFFNLR